MNWVPIVVNVAEGQPVSGIEVVIETNEFFAPVGGLPDGSGKDRVRSGAYIRSRDHVEKDLGVRIDGRQLVVGKWIPGVGINWAIASSITDVGEIAVAIVH